MPQLPGLGGGAAPGATSAPINFNAYTSAPVSVPVTKTASPAPVTPAINTAYQLQKGETIPAYNARVAAMSPNAPTSGNTSSNINPNASFQVPGALGSANLSAPNAPSITPPAPTQPYNTAALAPVTPPLTETPGQQEQSSLTKMLEDLNNQDAGKAAFQTSQETAAGLPDLMNSQNDLTSRLNTLINEGKAIPLQAQQDATGRAITAGGLAPIQAAATRENAIQSLAVSSQLDATKGLITSAQDKVTRAVEQQFGPIEAHITAAMANLKLIANDPNTTIQEKNQAQAQLDATKAQEAAIAQQKQDALDAGKAMTDAAQNANNFTPTSQYPTLATALDAIQHAPDGGTATMIAASVGLTAKAPTAAADKWSEPFSLGGDLVQKNLTTGEVRTAVNVASGSSAAGTWSAPYEFNGNQVQKNNKTGEIRQVGGSTSNNGATFTPTVKTQLAGAGNTASQINQLQQDIATHGPQYVVDNGNMDAKTQSIVETEFGVSKTQPAGSGKGGLFGLGFFGL